MTGQRPKAQEAKGAENLRANVQQLLEKYGGKEFVLSDSLTAKLDAQPHSRRRKGGGAGGRRDRLRQPPVPWQSSVADRSAPSAGTPPSFTPPSGTPPAGTPPVGTPPACLPGPGVGSSALLRAGVADDVSADAVATPFGLGTVLSRRPSDGALTVRFPWGKAILSSASVDASRAAALRSRLGSLGSVFSVLVDGLPQAARPPRPAGLSGFAAATVQGLGLIGTLLAWLEEAAKRPAAAHRDVLLEAAVLLSGLVRTRAELMRLVGKVSDSQLEAEKLAAGAVRIHLGLLERITSEAAPQPPQVGSLSDACRQWRQVIEQLTASRPAASPGGAGYAGDFYAWRSMRPGATRAEEVSVAVSGSTTVPFPFAAYPGALVQPALGQRFYSAASAVEMPASVHVHRARSTSPPVRYGPRTTSPMVTRVWPAANPSPSRLRVSSSAVTLGPVVPLAVSVAAPAAGTAPVNGVMRLVSAGPVLSGAPQRSASPLLARPGAATRWMSPTLVSRAGHAQRHPTPLRATPAPSPMLPTRGRLEYQPTTALNYYADGSRGRRPPHPSPHQPDTGQGRARPPSCVSSDSGQQLGDDPLPAAREGGSVGCAGLPDLLDEDEEQREAPFDITDLGYTPRDAEDLGFTPRTPARGEEESDPEVEDRASQGGANDGDRHRPYRELEALVAQPTRTALV